MPAPDPRVIIHLSRAQAEINAALDLMATPLLELPEGVEPPPEPCRHPSDKRHRPLGGREWCGVCGAKL